MSALPANDPFTTPETRRTGGLLSFASRLDSSPWPDAAQNGLSLMTPASPTQLKRALQARLEEVQKRLQEAGQLGESLVRQQRELQEKLKVVEEEVAKGGEINPDLRQRLTTLEREYNEVHKESTRALLSSKIHSGMDSPHKSPHSSTLQTLGTSSPTKLTVPSRRQRNQPSRSNDIEFATDIAQQLIAEVRKLQGILQERDETLKTLNEEKASLEVNAAYLESRIKKLEESENKYKEENWQLELVTQEKDATISYQSDTVTKLQSHISALEQEKNYYVREIDELRQTQAKVNDDNEATIRHHEGELATLRRLLAATESERDNFKRHIEELKQEVEEEQKLSVRLRHLNEELEAQRQIEQDPFETAQEGEDTTEGSPPTSPAKHTPRHGPLEAETLKNALQHAHRKIAGLKSDVNRERSEKSELKRQLAELREELDQHRKDVSAPPSAKKSRKDTFNEIKYKKPARPNLLGATRKPKAEITLLDYELDNADWEDESIDPQSPSPMGASKGRGIFVRSPTLESFGSEFETAQEESAFETANERNDIEEPTTPAGDSPTSADETETEGTAGKGSIYSGMGSFSRGSITPLTLKKSRDRGSFISIGSEDDDEQPFKLGGRRTLDPDAFQPREEFSPAQASQRLKLRVRSGKGRLGNRIPSDGSMFSLYKRFDSMESSPNQSIPHTASQSPISSMRPRGSISSVEIGRAGKSLFAELGGSFNENYGGDEADTPIRSGFGSPLRRTVEMVDASCNTEVPYPGAPLVVVPATPPAKPAMLESGTQFTPRHRPTMSESWTQSTPSRRVTFAESGTQATPAHRPVLTESATQFTPRPRAILFDPLAQFTPLSYVESSAQSDAVPKPTMVPIGMQSDSTLRTLNISSGIQFEGLPNLKADGPSSPLARKPVMVDMSSSPIRENKATPTYTSTGVQLDDFKTETSSVGIQHGDAVATTSAGVQSDEVVMVSLGMQSEMEVNPEMSEIGVQSDGESVQPKPEVAEIGTQADDQPLDKKPEMTEIGTQSDDEGDERFMPAMSEVGAQSDEEPVKVTEQVSIGTQFDPEMEKPEVEDVVVVMTPVIAKPEMIDMGTQFDTELEKDTEVEASEVIPILQPELTVEKGEQVDSAVQCDLILSVVMAGSSQTEPEAPPLPKPLSISVVEIAKQGPVGIEESITFSNIISLDTEPIEPEPQLASLARALPPIPVTTLTAEPSISSDEDTPKKVSESIELSRDRPITPTPQNGERPSFFDPIFRKPRVEDVESDSVAQDKGKKVDRRPVMVDQGVQTAITYESTDRFLKPVLVGTSLTTSPSYHPAHSPPTLHPPRTSSMQPLMSHDSFGKGKSTIRIVDNTPSPIKRPESSNSGRSFTASYPPLPEDHRQAIAAAQQKSAVHLESGAAMGPPILPASAFKNAPSLRPRTPVNGAIHILEESPASKGGSTPRPRYSHATIRSEFMSPPSHRSSMSSFASELDDRFRLNNEGSIPQQQLQNDPRIIQAITQTMIGEYLWKYTRSATKSSLSSNRHRRFFWVHPYTRTLYWSEQDPSTAGKHELRAKSVSIEAVRVINDDNPLPPGLHRKSLIVITPGRTIQFTAPTGQRHETWYMALSYLLTRKMDEEGGEDVEEEQQPQESTDVSPRYTGPRAASSLSSYNSRSTRHTSPVRNASSLSHRRPPPQTHPHQGSMSRLTRVFKSGSSKSSRHTSISTAAAMSLYDASEANDSVENMMRSEQERQDQDADRMEYVRACCDGKHDVGSLPRKGNKTIRGRRTQHYHSHHTHAHTQKPPQPQFARSYHAGTPEPDED